MDKTKTRCEGFRRHGNAFSLGPVTWTQCSENAIVNITVIQEGEQGTFPACLHCWTEATNNPKISILKADPIQLEEGDKQ